MGILCRYNTFHRRFLRESYMHTRHVSSFTVSFLMTLGQANTQSMSAMERTALREIK